MREINEMYDIVKTFFLQSRDFNGITGLNLRKLLEIDEGELRQLLREGIEAGQIDGAFASHSTNPHIKRIPPLSKEEQTKKIAEEHLETFCLYPGRELLEGAKELERYEERPYSKRLAIGEAQLTPVFFELSVLERYFSDPRYTCQFHGYAGRISISDKHYKAQDVPTRDKVLLETFGLGYDEDTNRVIAVFLRYLSNLSPEHERIWHAQEINRKCVMNGDYARATLYGGWPENQSAYGAFVLEQVELNKLAEMIGRPPLFRQTYEGTPPERFHPMLRPTRRQYEEFVHLLDKMLSENINRDFFKGEIPLEEEGQTLGTLMLLERWLREVYYHGTEGEEYAKNVVAPFKKIRTLRQKPAHRIARDEYDSTLPRAQDELLAEAYQGLKILRLIFASHPQAQGYKPPSWLEEVDIVIY